MTGQPTKDAPVLEPETHDGHNAQILEGDAAVATGQPAADMDKREPWTSWQDLAAVVRQQWQQQAPRVRKWAAVDARTWGRRVTTPLGTLVIVAIALLGLVTYALVGPFGGADTGSNSGGTPNMGGTGTQTQPSVPAATQPFGNQLAQFVWDKDGAKHFTFTAKQVMWEPVKGHPVLAWTLDGTVPGPMIRVTAGDHVRVTINNNFPEATTIHFHGLEIPSNEDGVPGIGQDPIQPGKSFTYDFTISDNNVGTYFYHSHYDDLTQVAGGLYGAFIVAPRPGSAQARQQVRYDQEYTQIISEMGGYYVINGKSFPDTQVMHVKHGQTTLVRVINLGELIHPMHLHGHFFTIVAEDGAPLAQPVQRDTLQIAPGESSDFTFYAWAAPGSIYPFHCHILSHVMNPGQSMTEMGGLITLVQYDK